MVNLKFLLCNCVTIFYRHMSDYSYIIPILISKVQNLYKILHTGLTLLSLAFCCGMFLDPTVRYGHLSLFQTKRLSDVERSRKEQMTQSSEFISN